MSFLVGPDDGVLLTKLVVVVFGVGDGANLGSTKDFSFDQPNFIVFVNRYRCMHCPVFALLQRASK